MAISLASIITLPRIYSGKHLPLGINNFMPKDIFPTLSVIVEVWNILNLSKMLELAITIN